MSEIRLRDSVGNIQRKLAVNDSTKRLEVRDVSDVVIVDIESHSSRHAYGGSDAIGADSLRYSQIQVAFGTEQTVNVGAGSTSVISEGVYIARCGANTKVEYSPDGGTTWYTLISAGGAGVVFSDGTNVRFNNAGASAENSYILPLQ